MGKCLGHFALSQYTTCDLPADQQQFVSAHLNDCDRCRGLLQQIEQDRTAYAALGQAPYNAAWQQSVSNRAPQSRQRSLFSAPFLRPVVWKIVLPAAVASVAAVLLVPRFISPPPTSSERYSGYKGNLSLQIIAKRGERQFTVSDGDRLCPGDALRFSITAEGSKNYVASFSIDQTGTRSDFYPNATTPQRFLAHTGRTLELTGQGHHELPGSIILDQSQGYEIIVMLVAPRPFDPKPFQARIQSQINKMTVEDRRRATNALTSARIGFSGTTHVVAIDKVPCS